MSETITVGLDLAKNVFQVHGADGKGEASLRKKLRRAQLLDAYAAGVSTSRWVTIEEVADAARPRLSRGPEHLGPSHRDRWQYRMHGLLCDRLTEWKSGRS